MSLDDYVNGNGANNRTYPLDPEMVNILEIDLSTERNREEFKIQGDFLFCVQCDQEGRTFDVFFNDGQQNDPFPMGEDGGFSGIPFDPIYISNEQLNGVTAKLLHIRSREGDRAPFWTEPAQAVDTFKEETATKTVGIPQTNVPPNDSVQVRGSDAAREEAIIKSEASNNGIIRISSDDVSSGTGLPLEPGEPSDPIKSTDVIEVHNNDTSTATVSGLEVKE